MQISPRTYLCLFILLTFSALNAQTDLPPSFYNRNNPEEKHTKDDPKKRQEELAKHSDSTIHNPELARWKAFEESKDRLLRTQAAVPVANWQSCGPNNQAGRMISYAFDPNNSQILWAGSASGGLWRTQNGGNSWQAMSDNIPSLAIGAIAINPHNPNVMLLGTGEGYVLSPLLQNGMGILKSIDGGLTWNTTAVNLPDSLDFFASLGFEWDPVDSNRVYLACTYGVLVSNDQGTNWSQTLIGVATSIEINPQNPSTLYVSLQDMNPSTGGIYRSTDYGQTWTMLTNGLPQSTDIGFTCLSLCDSFPNVIYAGVSFPAGSPTLGELQGLYKTSDGGNAWTLLPNTVDFYCYQPPYDYICQGWYGNVIKVMPYDTNVVFAAGIYMYRSADGGITWSLSDYAPAEDWQYIHPDYHNFAVDPSNAQTFYVFDDAGIFKSTDGGASWLRRDSGLVTTQFYTLSSSTSNPTFIMGGTQDNGIFYNYNVGTSMGWNQLVSGDGFFTAVDHGNDQVFYATELFNGRMKSTDGGFSFAPLNNGITDNDAFFTPLTMHPVNSQILFTATGNYIHRSTDGGATWTIVLATPSIERIEFDKVNPDIIYACAYMHFSYTDIFRSIDGGLNWTQIVTTSDPITDIETDPLTTGLVYLTCNRYTAGLQVWRSYDFGATWANCSGDFPGIPANTIAINPNNHDHLYVGTDLGVYMSIDRGVTWTSYNDNLPNVHVLDLHYYAADSSLRAGTHGRGIWKTPAADPSLVSTQEHFAVETIISVYPNPTKENATISYSTKQFGNVNVKVLDQLGQQVTELYDGEQSQGNHSLIWNGKNSNGQQVPAGIYFIRIISGNTATTAKVIIAK